jgi:uncharacterized protein (DUF1015 family)
VPRVAPFRGLTYDVEVAGPLDRLTAPPYDIISDPRRDRLLTASPFNVVHLDLAEGSSDPEEAGNRYDRAAELLRSWRASGALRVDDEASYHAYEMAFELEGEPRVTRGVFVAMELEPWGGDVLPHEDTMPGPVEDRLCLLRATRTHISAVYATADGPIEPLAGILEERTADAPEADVTDEEGVRHRRWRLPGDTPIAPWLEGRHALIADGHHRYTTALAYREERDAGAGGGPWDRILTLIVDASRGDVAVLPYHRVQVLGDPPPDGEPVADLEALLASIDDETLSYGTVRRAPEGPRFARHRLGGRPPTVEALHREVLDTIAPGDALRFTHDVDDAIAAVASGAAVTTYLLPPTTPGRILAAVEAGERLPRKSTFFWPKPRTGMVMMPLDVDEGSPITPDRRPTRAS